MLFVGVKTGDGITYESFRAAETPTHETHGHRFGCVIGPFRTVAGALFLMHHGHLNPHCRCVSEAEKLARTVGVDKSLPRTKHYPAA
jgi:hypothetical protein